MMVLMVAGWMSWCFDDRMNSNSLVGIQVFACKDEQGNEGKFL